MMALANDPYSMPPKYKKPQSMVALRYADGRAARRGDTVRDAQGRELKIIGMDDIANQLLVIAGGHLERIDPTTVEKVRR